MLRLLILSTITAEGFVREARPIVVGYVVEDCCLKFVRGVCRVAVGYAVNHYCWRVCQRCASCCCSICCRRLLLEVCWWSVSWCGWVYCQPLLFLSLLAECVVVVLVILSTNDV